MYEYFTDGNRPPLLLLSYIIITLFAFFINVNVWSNSSNELALVKFVLNGKLKFEG